MPFVILFGFSCNDSCLHFVVDTERLKIEILDPSKCTEDLNRVMR